MHLGIDSDRSAVTVLRLYSANGARDKSWGLTWRRGGNSHKTKKGWRMVIFLGHAIYYPNNYPKGGVSSTSSPNELDQIRTFVCEEPALSLHDQCIASER